MGHTANVEGMDRSLLVFLGIRCRGDGEIGETAYLINTLYQDWVTLV